MPLLRITPGPAWSLFDATTTRCLEQAALQTHPPHTLMQRAGLATARLARALAPHARTVWVACGAGNNGGDGLEAAWHLRQQGLRVVVSWLGQPDTCPRDARRSWEKAQALDLEWSDAPPKNLGPQDLCIDALLGIGVATQRRTGDAARLGDPRLEALLQALHRSPAPVLCVDLPSGLEADTGHWALPDCQTLATTLPRSARHTLSLLTLKPGLFTAQGRDAAGQVWWDDLGVCAASETPQAHLAPAPVARARAHTSHKGRFGDVAVVGGEGLSHRGMGMGGAALLAGSAALQAGAGRVLVALLDAQAPSVDAQQPELMLRHVGALDLPTLTVVCGCGGGEAVREVLPAVLSQSPRLVLDADALNAVALDPALAQALRERAARQQTTVLTPHPLEAARLLGVDTATVQADRLRAARDLAASYGCVALLKGSGTVVASPEGNVTINPTGNGLLATAGTGDVLAGLVGALLTQGLDAPTAARTGAYLHGAAADQWSDKKALTAGELVKALRFG